MKRRRQTRGVSCAGRGSAATPPRGIAPPRLLELTLSDHAMGLQRGANRDAKVRRAPLRLGEAFCFALRGPPPAARARRGRPEDPLALARSSSPVDRACRPVDPPRARPDAARELRPLGGVGLSFSFCSVIRFLVFHTHIFLVSRPSF